MWFTFVTARLFHSLSIQPRLAAMLLSSCSVANSPTRRVGLSPTLRPASLAQASLPSVGCVLLYQLTTPPAAVFNPGMETLVHWPADGGGMMCSASQDWKLSSDSTILTKPFAIT